MIEWFARPVLHVKNVDASIEFYRNKLGFTISWRYEEGGQAQVAQVERQGCALILAGNLNPDNIGRAVIFVSLNVDQPNTASAALDALRVEFQSRGIQVKEGSWGYRLLIVDDSDGNQLFFNYPNEELFDRPANLS